MFTSLSGKVFFVICLLFVAGAAVQAQGVTQEASLTKKESRKMTRILCKCFTSYKHMYPLQRYNRQYVAYINGNGEKEVIVNCYYKRSETNLEEAKLPGAIGKESYFRATINLHTLQAQDFGFHESPVPAQQDVSLK
jgi:hypothetical protein